MALVVRAVVLDASEVLGIMVVLLVVGLNGLYGVVRTVGFTERVMGIMIGGRAVVLVDVEEEVAELEELVIVIDSKKNYREIKISRED